MRLHACASASCIRATGGGGVSGWHPHCDSRNIQGSRNATSNYYVGRDTIVAKGVTGVGERRKRNNNARERMYSIARGEMERRIQAARHNILSPSPVSVAVHYDCILSGAPYSRIQHLILKWKLLYYVVHVSRARNIGVINLADPAVISKGLRRTRKIDSCCYFY